MSEIPTGVQLNFSAKVEVNLKVEPGDDPAQALNNVNFAHGYASAVMKRAVDAFERSILDDDGYVPESSFDWVRVDIGETPPEPTPEPVESVPEQDDDGGTK